ncbi:PAS domain S-box protein [Flavobacterium sufflavum]|uniref:Sensory/regulatory protein RpfC n=1 Tax=Flavobacterium sufflavum TaxID=1921138 RepID=A0A3S2U0K3_9FLAO|nr:PAS domain S-box protein [Flavobacterium sufflavum]RVT73975.1 PAS domain S-box protein [Flavobacterium sufflavum]
MKEKQLTYEELLHKINKQEQIIQELEKEVVSKKSFFNEFQENSKEALVLIYSLCLKDNGELSYSNLSGAVEAIYGFGSDQTENAATLVFDRIHPEDREEVLNKIRQSLLDLIPIKLEYRYLHPVKGLLWHEMNATSSIEIDGTVVSHGIITDNTLRVEAEQKKNKTKRLYRFINRINQIIVRTKDENQLFKEICTVAVEVGKFKMAWIGKIDFNTQSVIPVSIGGDDKGYLDGIKISTEIHEITGRGPVGIAIRQESYVVCNSIEDDPLMAPWKGEALKRDLCSLMAIPIKMFDIVIGVFVIYAAEKNYFNDEEIKLLGKATNDVIFALEFFEKETMRKKAEEAAVQSEKRYHTLAEVSPVGIYRTDLNGATTYINQRWSQIVGINFEQAMGNGWFIAIHPDDRVKLYNEWKKVVGNRDKSFLEYRFIKPDGSIIWVIGQATPETNAENEVIGFIGTITDISKRKQVEDKFVRTNKKLEAIIQAIPDMIFEIGIDEVIYNYHSQNTDVLLMPLELFIGKKIPEVLPPDAAEVCLYALKEASEKGLSNGRQYTLDMPDGKHWYELSVAPMKEKQREVPRFICISRDITDAKLADEALLKSQERYSGLLDNLGAGIVVHTADSSIIMCNQKASELLGSSIEDLLQKNDANFNMKFINEDSSIMALEDFPISQILHSKKPIKNFALGILHIDKSSVVWVLVNGFPTFNENGDINEVVISFIDVTEQKLMDFEIKKAKEQAEAANKYKTDFLANMSHEIRTPLNGIIGFTSLLMESKLGETQYNYMRTINESATTLMDIVNDILDFSKIEAGKLELQAEEIDLFALTNQIISLFKYQASQKQIDLILDIAPNVPQFIFVDPLRLKQIIINLVGNAIKFTQKGKIQLDIEAISPFETDDTNLSFSVKDTGIGIQPKNQDKIFNSFVQEDNSTSRQFGGTGLGLAISNQLLAMMNSKLQLESTFGQGSNFYFFITLKKSNFHIQHQSNEDKMQEVKSISGTKKVLIVEDNKINMFLAKTLIQRIIPDCLILEAFDGDQAIEQYKIQQPDIILMDIQMPNKNGFEATYEIRKIEQDSFTPIIALTAGIFIEEKEECLKSGMNDYITKPIIPSDLEIVLDKWLMD